MENEIPRLQAESDALARAAGYALSTWTIVENRLTDLFREISGTEQLKAHVIMDAIISFDARLKVVCDLMELCPWEEAERNIWNILVNRLTEQHKKRHHLAHFQIINRSDGKHTRAVLSPFFSTLAAQTGKLREMSAKDIDERSQRFRACAICLAWFVQAASLQKSRPEEPLPQDSDPVRDLRKAVAQSLADKARHARPSQG
jgi:hypothetical protein